VPGTVPTDLEAKVFCVHEPRAISGDTGPIAAVIFNCADPPAVARFWNSALDWTLHESTDDLAWLRWVAGAVHI
jgi:hypothetical protein